MENNEEKLPVMGKQWLIRTIPASFGSFYLTLISMIQGIALSSLSTQIPNIPFNIVDISYAILTFIVIIIIWHEYVLAAQEFWWNITPLDSLCPFLIGMSEFLMIYYLNVREADRGSQGQILLENWFFAATFMTAAGWLAYYNYDQWITEGNFSDGRSHKRFKTEINRGRWLIGTFTLINAIITAILKCVSPISQNQQLACGTLFLLFLICMIWKRLAWQQNSLKRYGLSREKRRN